MPNVFKRWSYWSDPTWRLIRACQLVIVVILLTLLVIYLAGENSVLYPLSAAVILNIVAATFVVTRSVQLRRRNGTPGRWKV
jgi:hypothetical protein